MVDSRAAKEPALVYYFGVLIEIVLIFSELQKSRSGPDFRAIVQAQALVRGLPVISSFINQV